MKHENLVLSNELIRVKLLPWKIWKADVSSVSPSSERMVELFPVRYAGGGGGSENPPLSTSSISIVIL